MTTSTNDNEISDFSQYGKDFQEKIVQAMLVDPKWAEQLTEVIQSEYFDVKYLRFLADRYFSYAKKYKVFPTIRLLITIVKDDLRNGSDKLLKEQVIEFIQRIRKNPNMGDLGYVKDKSLDFCRKQALKKAMEQAIDLISDNRYETVVDIIKKAVSLGIDTSIGHNFFEDAEARFVEISRNPIPTGLPSLDAPKILQGGVGKGELAICIAGSGAGKSHFLIAMGCSALREYKNVLHYTMELSQNLTSLRYDSNLCDIPSDEIISRKDEVLKFYETNKFGKLIVKYFPPHTATINTIRTHVEKLKLMGFEPDLIIIDYLDLMKSSRALEALRLELKLIYEEVRGFLNEMNVCCWSASQTNRNGLNAEVIDGGDVGESLGKLFTADIMVGLSRKSSEKSLGTGRLFLTKNRIGRDGLNFNLKIDTAKSKFEIINETTFEEIFDESSKQEKNKIKQRWDEFQKTKEKLKEV